MSATEFSKSNEQPSAYDELGPPPTRISDLHPPEIDGKFPLNEAQIAELAAVPRILACRQDFPLINLNGAPIINAEQSVDLYHRQKERFDQAHTVIAECRSIGLGDAFNHLRYALLLAEKRPDKHVIIAVNQPIADLASLAVPLNAHIMTNYEAGLLQDPRVFVVKFQLVSLLQEYFALQQIHRETYDRFRQIEADGRYATYHNSLAFQWEHLAQVLGIDPEAHDYNVSDLINATRLQLLGIPICETDICKPIMRSTEEDDDSYHYDLLIVPDAGEDAWDGRSVKSLSADTWGQIIACLPGEMRIGIVKGHQHPAYTEQVSEIARRQGAAVEDIETISLDDFCDVVRRSRRYVGGDTGPTHLARDVIKAAYQAGREIAFREVYDEGRHPLREYGTVGNGEDGKTLVANTRKVMAAGEIGYDSDLDRVDPLMVATFILS